MAYLGFILRRRRVPSAAKNFPILASMSMALLLESIASQNKGKNLGKSNLRSNDNK